MTDPDLEKLASYRSSKSGRSGKNAARDFHRYARRAGKVFGVKISQVKVPIRVKKPNKSGRKIKREEIVDFPIITLSSWMCTILSSCPQFFLGGHDLEQEQLYGDMLQSFWDRFVEANPEHPMKEKPSQHRRFTVPVAVHGDEGRGLGHVPLLEVSYQVVIPYHGANELNLAKTFVKIRYAFGPWFTFLKQHV